MDLFKINRFTGGETAEVGAGDPQQILDRLHQKAEERKRKGRSHGYAPGRKNRRPEGNTGSGKHESRNEGIVGEIPSRVKDGIQGMDDGNITSAADSSLRNESENRSGSGEVGGETHHGSSQKRKKKKRRSSGVAAEDVTRGGGGNPAIFKNSGGTVGNGEKIQRKELGLSSEEGHSLSREQGDGQKNRVIGEEEEECSPKRSRKRKNVRKSDGVSDNGRENDGNGREMDLEIGMDVGGKVAENERRGISSSQKRKKRSRMTGDKSISDVDRAVSVACRDLGDSRGDNQAHELGSPGVSPKRKAEKTRREKKSAVPGDEAEDGDRSGDGPSEDTPKEETEEGEMFPVLGDFTHARKEKVIRVLPEWLAKPTRISSDIKHHSLSCGLLQGLDKRILATLATMKITSFFPVQNKVIPLVLRSAVHGVFMGPAGYRPGDLCVAAPTGSGKTLAFAIPIVQILMDRVTQHLRALVVLPTKDLASQVFKVFLQLTNGTPLNVVMIGGQRTLKDEGSLLVRQSANGEFLSACDIVVATPGRLVDHINHTRGFTLRHLRFLVIDEADNLMVQHSKDWISRVEKEIEGSRVHSRDITVESEAKMEMPFQKLLFSATLSHNPEHLIHFRLFQPQLVTSVDSHDPQSTNAKAGGDVSPAAKYVTPASLEEYYMVCDISDKPLLIVHLLKNLGCTQVLCFTNSVEASHRLYLLMTKMAGVGVGEFSSKLSGAQRQAMIKQFKNDTIQLLICSDAMARGMDLSNVKYVVSYDAPLHLKTYIHRVGRTARAGRQGTAYTILLEDEVSKFERIVGKSSAAGIKQVHVEEEDLDRYRESYQRSLRRLPSALKDEIYQQKNR